jgi:YidC/Oxa1 family membrane protein insertase
MEFGLFRPVCILLLNTLNGFNWVIPSYGLAIILLTGLVRLVFWPVTHKANQSMKEMQKIKPLMDELREKYKGNPQKLNQETMLLYREHKVNPLSGCLPMLIQIPVFFALYTMLRSAVELRLEKFLWIRDLSEPEALFEGMIPLIGSLNILPLLMTATMIWQQKLTPSMGDPQQQKMMMMMSAVMMFMFYGMPSGLLLYWTVSQCLAILQLLMHQKKPA